MMMLMMMMMMMMIMMMTMMMTMVMMIMTGDNNDVKVLLRSKNIFIFSLDFETLFTKQSIAMRNFRP